MSNALHLALRIFAPFAVASLLLACGGPSWPNDVARIPRVLPNVESVASFRATEPCSQGPFEIAVRATGAPYGENFSLFVVGANGTTSGSFIVSAGPRERALVKARGRFQTNEAGPGSSCSGSSSPGSLAPAPTAGGAPGDLVTSFGGPIHPLIREPFPPFPAGEEIRISFRFDRPVPLSATTFNLVRAGFRPNVPPNEWAKVLDDKRAALDSSDSGLYALQCGVHCNTKQEDRPLLEFGKPAPRTEWRTPRPSKHATWIAGFWTKDPARVERLTRGKTAILPSESFVWFPGFWFVPPADLLDRETMVSPIAPPDPLAETPPRPPMEGAVWIEGIWAFSGTEWIWSPGHWRHPKMRPSAKARWVNDGLWVRYFPESY
ncbi:MAG: hypothetical protein KBF88_00705 [Polyangiaceae bacterium]|nr:hypothetical protein [Polyangiaceae bacterium]